MSTVNQSVESGRDAILQKLVDRLMVKLEKGEDITDEMESELKKIAIGTQSKKILAQVILLILMMFLLLSRQLKGQI